MAPGNRSGGGLPARRAVVRWAARTVRRGWRQQALVVLLLVAAVATATGFATAAYNIAPAADEAEFGTASHFLRFRGDAATLDASVAAANQRFGTIEVIGHRPFEIPGRFEPLDHRTQQPGGPFGDPLLSLREGSYPSTPGEVAVTPGVAAELGLGIGEPLALDGTPRTIVGLVENPSDLGDEFALLPPAGGAEPASVTVLVEASDDEVLSFRSPVGGDIEIASRGDGSGALAAAIVLLVATVAMLLVALLAAAGFIVMARRRQAQLGVLAAIGATERHLRLALVANGTIVGVVGAVIGAPAGVAGWLAAEPVLETALGHRIDRFNISWWVVAGAMLLAVTAATAAAWWPARVAARQSIVHALSGRPPRPEPVRRSAGLAAALLAAGVACLLVAGDVADDYTVHWDNVALLCAGTVLAVTGSLLLSPAVLRLLGASAAPLPFVARLALRDLARYQSRSGVALAATALALGIPSAIAIGATAAQSTAATGNLPENQLIVRTAGYDGPFVPDEADLDRLRPHIERLAGQIDGRSTELEIVVDPDLVNDSSYEGRIALTLVERQGDGWVDVSLLYVAAPLLRGDLVGSGAAGGADIATTGSGQLGILGTARPDDPGQSKVEPVGPVDALQASYTSLPTSFVSLDAAQRRGWELSGSGRWLIETDDSLTAEQLASARAVAAGAGLTVESRDHQRGLGTLRTAATVTGAIAALGVLAMTVGLLRSETAPDLRTLTATGATSSTRRALTACTAAALAAAGLALGLAAATTVLMSGYLNGPEVLGRLPVELALLAAGTPGAAALGGWLLSGAEPAGIGRQPMA